VDDLHVADEAVLLDLGLPRFLRRVVDADALAALRRAPAHCQLQLPLKAHHLPHQLLLRKTALLQLAADAVVSLRQKPLRSQLLLHLFYLHVQPRILPPQLINFRPQRPALHLPLALHCRVHLPGRLLVEMRIGSLLLPAHLAQSDALIKQFFIILLQLAVGVAQLLVGEVVVAAAPAAGSGETALLLGRLRGLFQLLEDVDLRGHLLCAPGGLPPRLDQRLLVEEDGTELVARLVLHLLKIAQTVEDLLEVLLRARQGMAGGARGLVIGVKVLHFEYNNNWG
jgi:hypothetical protein